MTDYYGDYKMIKYLEDGDYSYVASTKTITLAAPYDALSLGQIISIRNLETKSLYYDSESQRFGISISGADIVHTYGDSDDADADELQIIIDTAITKNVTQIQDWTAVAQNTIVKSVELDFSGKYAGIFQYFSLNT